MTTEQLLEQVRAGSPRHIARMLSKVEDGSEDLPDFIAALSKSGWRAPIIGITGAPGVGKSTTTSAVISAYRAAGKRVGVLAVDPSSPFSGGALLGDRVRMQQHATDPGVFIRSMASRGHLGGLARATPQAIRVLDAAGCDVIIIETVGVGQSEVEIAHSADTTIVLVAPGMGDGVQAAKAGILEIGDIFGVNKADRDGAPATARELRHMISLGEKHEWTPPVVQLVATTGVGLDELMSAIDAHTEYLNRSGEGHRRRKARIANEITAIAVASIQATFDSEAIDALAERVLAGDIDPYRAARELTGDR